jgi:hypothetical protein
MSSFPLVVSPEIITLVLEKNEVLSVFSIIIICKQFLNTFTVSYDTLEIWSGEKYYIIFVT